MFIPIANHIGCCNELANLVAALSGLSCARQLVTHSVYQRSDQLYAHSTMHGPARNPMIPRDNPILHPDTLGVPFRLPSCVYLNRPGKPGTSIPRLPISYTMERLHNTHVARPAHKYEACSTCKSQVFGMPSSQVVWPIKLCTLRTQFFKKCPQHIHCP